MGSEQSKQNNRFIKSNSKSSLSQKSSIHSNSKSENLFNGKIVVVNKQKSKSQDEEEKEFFNYLNKNYFNTLLPRNQDNLPSYCVPIDHKSLTTLLNLVQKFLKEKSQLASDGQNEFYEKIKEVDYVTAYIVNLLNEKEKNFIKTMDSFDKLYDFKNQAENYRIEIDKCMKTIENLNNILPLEHQLDLTELKK